MDETLKTGNTYLMAILQSHLLFCCASPWLPHAGLDCGAARMLADLEGARTQRFLAPGCWLMVGVGVGCRVGVVAGGAEVAAISGAASSAGALAGAPLLQAVASSSATKNSNAKQVHWGFIVRPFDKRLPVTTLVRNRPRTEHNDRRPGTEDRVLRPCIPGLGSRCRVRHAVKPALRARRDRSPPQPARARPRYLP